MKASTSPQDSRTDLELEDLRIEHETPNYRIEYGRLGEMQCRVVTSQNQSMMPSLQSWFDLRENASHSNLPHHHVQSSASITAKHQLVETWYGSVDLDTFLADRDELLTELSAVYLTLQAATLINYLKQMGSAIAQLDERHFVVDERLHELPKLTYTGWVPTEDVYGPIESSDGLHLIARILYRCLTGSLPPSSEVPDTLMDDPSTNLGFDNLLMTWVTEERELGALGQCALDALHGAESEESILDFIREVYPHLQQATQQAITTATDELISERRLLSTVEKHRGKLKELRTRHQYLTGWLIDHEPELDKTSKRLAHDQAYTEAFTAYAEQVRKQVKRGMSDGRASANANAMRILNDNNSEPLANDAPLRFTDLDVDFEDEIPLHADDVSVHEDPPVEEKQTTTAREIDVMSSSAPRSENEPSRPASAMKVFVFVILSATILGVLFAWSLLSTRVQSEQSNDAVIFQKESK